MPGVLHKRMNFFLLYFTYRAKTKKKCNKLKEQKYFNNICLNLQLKKITYTQECICFVMFNITIKIFKIIHKYKICLFDICYCRGELNVYFSHI